MKKQYEKRGIKMSKRIDFYTIYLIFRKKWSYDGLLCEGTVEKNMCGNVAGKKGTNLIRTIDGRFRSGTGKKKSRYSGS